GRGEPQDDSDVEWVDPAEGGAEGDPGPPPRFVGDVVARHAEFEVAFEQALAAPRAAIVAWIAFEQVVVQEGAPPPAARGVAMARAEHERSWRAAFEAWQAEQQQPGFADNGASSD
ncbi:unnamed protein product, partial [Prorocentrum cordatum]